MDTPGKSRLPLEQWGHDMQTATHTIIAVGTQLLATHRAASPKAAEVALQWKLAERLEEEREALNVSFEMLRRILTSIDTVRQTLSDASSTHSELSQTMRASADTIKVSLPTLHSNFLVVRHCALDLLRWTQRFAELPESRLPDEYRACYARLLDYTPIFRPTLEAMQQDLLHQHRNERLTEDLHEFHTQLTHYMAAVDSARAFVNSVVRPPMELVFHDTHTFQADWTQRTPEEQALLATELNDQCQLLLYDAQQFHDQVHNVPHALPQDLEATLCVLPVDDWRIIFSVDEDPVFEQILVTLLRVVPAKELDPALTTLIPMLYRDFHDE